MADPEEAGQAWLRDQLLLHSEDMDGGTASDLAGYVFAMSREDAKEFLSELLPASSPSRIDKICTELNRRRGITSAAPPAAPSAKTSLKATAKPWGPKKVVDKDRAKTTSSSRKGRR